VTQANGGASNGGASNGGASNGGASNGGASNGGTGSTEAEDYTGPVWSAPRELGSGGAGLASLGQGPVAILAGFDLTTVILLTTSGGTDALRQAAIACFGVAAALFILAMTFITTAEDYSATPDDRMMYKPEARISASELELQRGDQWQDGNLLSIYYNYRVGPSVTLAVIGTLAGLVLVLLGHDHLIGPDIAAGATTLVALAYLADWLKRGGNWWLFPRPVLTPAGQRVRQGPFRALTARRRLRLQVIKPTLAWPMNPAGHTAMSAEFDAEANGQEPRTEVPQAGTESEHLEPPEGGGA
jgi:hypothetical protein